MTESAAEARAEAFVLFRAGTARTPVLDAAREFGRDRNFRIEIEARPGRVHLLAEGVGTHMTAMEAVTGAALALIGAMGDETAMIESVRRASPIAHQRRIAARGVIAKPQTLMDAVSSAPPPPDNAREAFRNFMTSQRLRPTSWAKDAGVASGEILGFLTGRSRSIAPETAQKLAHAARVRVEDMFR